MNDDKHWLLERKGVLCNVLMKSEMPIELIMSTVQCGVVCCSSFQASMHQTAFLEIVFDTILEKWVTLTYIVIPSHNGPVCLMAISG